MQTEVNSTQLKDLRAGYQHNILIYNDTTGGQGIVQDVYFEVGQNSVSFPIEDVTRFANQALDEMTSIAINSNGTWQYDDSNNTDLPIGTTGLITDQADYSFDENYLTIEEMRVLRNGATQWDELIPVDRNDPTMKEILISYENISGIPEYYDIFGETVLLYPKPNYTQLASLKAFFQRKSSYFTVSDTTKEPGFPKHLHKYVSLYISFSFAHAKGLDKKKDLWERLMVEKKRIEQHFAKREKTMEHNITPETVNPF